MNTHILTQYVKIFVPLHLHMAKSLASRFTLVALLGALLPTQAYAIDKWDYKLDLDYGARTDQLNWNIAGTLAGTNPNVISELQWSDVGFHEARLGFRFIGDNIWYLKGYAAKAWGFKGSVQDSDYNGDNRSLEFSRSNSSAKRSSAQDFSIALGQQFRIDNLFGITPLVGFSNHRQTFTMTNGNQTLCDPNGIPYDCNGGLGLIEGLNSTFDTHWRGPWFGLDLRWAAAKGFTTYAELEYHYSHYDAQGNWNLRPDLKHPKSYGQTASGRGKHLGLGLSYALAKPNSFFNIGFKQVEYATQAGEQTFYFADDTVASQRLNGVNWHSRSVTVGFTSQF